MTSVTNFKITSKLDETGNEIWKSEYRKSTDSVIWYDTKTGTIITTWYANKIDAERSVEYRKKVIAYTPKVIYL